MQYAPDSLHYITWNQITVHSFFFRLTDPQIIPDSEELHDHEGPVLIFRLTHNH